MLVCWAEPLTLGMRILPLFRQYASKSSLLYGATLTLNHGGGSVHVTQLEQSSRIHVIGVSLVSIVVTIILLLPLWYCGVVVIESIDQWFVLKPFPVFISFEATLGALESQPPPSSVMIVFLPTFYMFNTYMYTSSATSKFNVVTYYITSHYIIIIIMSYISQGSA